MNMMSLTNRARSFACSQLTAALKSAPKWQLTDVSDVREASTSASVSTSQPVVWVFLGPPGVGKGTYAKRMAKRFNLAHIATGDLIRDEIKSGSTIGKQASHHLYPGSDLVP